MTHKTYTIRRSTVLLGLAWLGLVLLVCYLVDRRLYPPAGLGHWLKLRFRLSTVASLCCFIGAAAL